MANYKHLSNIRLTNLFKSRRARLNNMIKINYEMEQYDIDVGRGPYSKEDIEKAKTLLKEVKDELDLRQHQYRINRKKYTGKVWTEKELKKLSSERLFNIFKRKRAIISSMYRCSCGYPGCDMNIAPKDERDKASKEFKLIKAELDSRKWQKPRRKK